MELESSSYIGNTCIFSINIKNSDLLLKMSLSGNTILSSQQSFQNEYKFTFIKYARRLYLESIFYS